METVNLGLIIPTMNRTSELNRLLDSIYSQSVKPSVLIIVDASDNSIEEKISKHEDVKIIYNWVNSPGLTKQRNIGISLVPDEITHIGFLDDDLVLLERSLECMVEFLANTGVDVGGVSFNIIDKNFRPKSKLHYLKILLGIVSLNVGKISRAGSICPNMNLKDNISSEWLCGGATIWSKAVFQNFKYDEWYKGYALWEDVDFSYRVHKNHKLIVLNDARVNHLHVVNNSRKNFMYLGDVEVVDRFYFVNKNGEEFSTLAAVYASLGTMLLNLAMAFKTLDSAFVARAGANFSALLRCLCGNISRNTI